MPKKSKGIKKSSKCVKKITTTCKNPPEAGFYTK
jgi:hypothetical protein